MFIDIRAIRRYAQRGRWALRRSVRANRLGLDWTLDLRDNVQRHLYRTGSYEPEITARIVRALPQHGSFLDVGAHIGIHALAVALRRPDVRVVAFEPTDDSANRLAYAARGLTNVELVRTALGSAPGRVTLKTDPEFGAHDASVRSAVGPGAVVGEFPVDTLDRWADRLDRLDVLKIDVEGQELDVVQGAARTLERLRPRLLVVEIQEHLLDRAGVHEGAIDELLARLGYRRGEQLEKNVLFEWAAGPERFSRAPAEHPRPMTGRS